MLFHLCCRTLCLTTSCLHHCPCARLRALPRCNLRSLRTHPFALLNTHMLPESMLLTSLAGMLSALSPRLLVRTTLAYILSGRIPSGYILSGHIRMPVRTLAERMLAEDIHIAAGHMLAGRSPPALQHHFHRSRKRLLSQTIGPRSPNS